MIKRLELASPDSCLNRAYPDEMLFVLLARDPAAPRAMRSWVTERIRLGKNQIGDPQIVEAIRLAEQMEQQRTMQELFEGHTPPVHQPSATPIVTVHQPKGDMKSVVPVELREVAQRVADELTSYASTGLPRLFQYAPHLVRLGQELQEALDRAAEVRSAAATT